MDLRTSSGGAIGTPPAGWIESNLGLNSWWAPGNPASPGRKIVPSRPRRNASQSGAEAAGRLGAAGAGRTAAGRAVASAALKLLARAAAASTPPALRTVRRSMRVTITELLARGDPSSPR